MKNWYRLTDDIHSPGRWQVRTPVSARTGEEVDPWAFTEGKPYVGHSELEADFDPGVRLDFSLGGISVPFVSAKLGAELKQLAGDDLQMIPVNVGGDMYFVVNAIRTATCLDESRSVFTKWAAADGRPDKVGKYRMVPRLVVDPRQLEGASIARIKDWNVALLVSHEVKNAIEAGGFTGAVFEPVTPDAQECPGEISQCSLN